MRWTSALCGGLVSAALTGTLACCSSAPVDPAGATSTQTTTQTSTSTQPQPQPQPTVVANPVQQDVQRAVDSFNATAGGPVSGQQAALAALLDDGQRSVQGRCAVPTTTLKFEPVYGRLVPAPGWKPSQGTLSGTVYALPTLIRIYTGNRITGTDLTDLHVVVQDGRARLPALCAA
jgi:hypothetical protein